jgi:hypothetical protein
MEPDIQAYVSVMEEIKRRTEVIFALLKRDIKVKYEVTQVETMILQVRMITELIALASLAANKTIFEQNQKKFEKHWHPSKILKDIGKLNPNFYPRPIVEVSSENNNSTFAAPKRGRRTLTTADNQVSFRERAARSPPSHRSGRA